MIELKSQVSVSRKHAGKHESFRHISVYHGNTESSGFNFGTRSVTFPSLKSHNRVSVAFQLRKVLSDISEV